MNPLFMFMTLGLIFNAAHTANSRSGKLNLVCGQRHPSGLDLRGAKPSGLEFANFGEFPWTVAILSNRAVDRGVWNDDTLQGGGSLIGPRAVLTAAHSVRQAEPFPLKVRAGEGDIDVVGLNKYVESPVETIVIHEDYDNETYANDIALLILKKPIDIDEHIGFVCLPEQGQDAPVVDDCYSTGWGKDEDGGTTQHNLKRIKLPIVERRKCIRALRRSRLGPFYRLQPSVLCAGGDSAVDTCPGDGGAPLVCPVPATKNRYKQFGIVSWGVGCGDKETPGGYAKVADFRQWIDDNMSRRGLSTTTYVFQL